MSFYTFIQLAAVLTTGLIAGLFYGYDCSVIRGLGNLPDDQYVSAFQSINKAILNPYFFTGFMGALVLLPAATLTSLKSDSMTPFFLLLTATLIYAAGVFGVTVIGNVPLNEKLEQFDTLRSNSTATALARRQFEATWNTWHRIRTIASIVCFALALASLIRK